MKIKKSYLKKVAKWYIGSSNDEYLSKHTEFEKFAMPKTFYFRLYPDRKEIHWAIIKSDSDKVYVYFINNWGRVFDLLEFKNIKIARRQLRKNGFDFSTNRFCPFMPPEPIYIDLSKGCKTAPYSKGNLWKSVKRSIKRTKKFEKTFFKQIIKHYEWWQRKDLTPLKNIDKSTPQKENKTFFLGCAILLISFIIVFVLVILSN